MHTFTLKDMCDHPLDTEIEEAARWKPALDLFVRLRGDTYRMCHNDRGASLEAED